MKSVSKRKIEITLFPIVILLGITSGLMFCSFLLGYSAGNKVGFKEARDADVVRMTRTNIGGVIQNDITRLEKSKIYKKLQEPTDPDIPVNSESSESLLLNDLLAKKKKQEKTDTPKNETKKVETIGSLIAKKRAAEMPKEAPKKIDFVEPKKEVKPKEEVKIVKKPKEVEPAKPKETINKRYLKQTIPEGWYAQVAAPTDISEANNLADKLHSSGFRLVVEKAVINGNTYYRVLVGAEKNKTQALRLVDQLVREPFIKTTPFVRKIS